MFAARLHDATLADFSRYEAAQLIPKSNPFLRKLFGYIAGPDIDERIMRTVDNLADVFRATNVEQLLKNFGKSTQTQDPIIHFYETFLAEYDPKLRKARGVWYTPEPVVNFIVRAVDDILKTEFDLPHGLADTSKTKIKVPVQGSNKMQETEVHKVQILDPATGTGTFLAEVVKLIYSKRFKAMQGAWSGYVDEHLIPRLNGFELLMASYSMAHLKLDMLLHETGYKPTKNQRFNIYLTNSLEEHHPDTGTLFSNWLSTEANEANHIKRDTPVMCVIGNPPYSVSSTNKGEWIQNLIADYKKDLNERKINLDDDYIKFIRYGQYYIDKNGEGILAYISNNSFIDGITHRQMRKSLLESFDKVYILDLHGSAKKIETALDGSKDENVFDIQQGVSINIFVKTNDKKKGKLAEVNHFELYGLRDEKYFKLLESNFNSFNWSKLDYSSPNYFFVPKDFSDEGSYIKGFKLDDVFIKYVSGFQTKRDKTTIKLSKKELQEVKSIFEINEVEDIRKKLGLPEDGRDWTIEWAKKDLKENNPIVTKVMYRPFDDRFTYYTGKSKGFVAYPRSELFSHLNKNENVSLITCRQLSTFDFQHLFASRFVSDMCNISSQTKETGYIFSLYQYPATSTQQSIGQAAERTPNLNPGIVKQIAEKLGLTFTNEKEAIENTFAPIDLLDYIYAVLHSPTYREKYKEFLKIDFPRVPYPKDADTFWQLVKLGGEIRQIHLLESPIVEQYITQYPIDGDNTVGKPTYKDGKVYINDTQYFDNVPQVAWAFYIGGYQPAQKWLKDRKNRKLEFDDILHYQKIIVALNETDRLMKEIDNIEIE
jgi:predicted helicase